VGLYEKKQDIMKTVIIAPSDGSVVSVDLKKSYVLSAQDYSSRTAIKLVDINTIKFQGTVDEIDISKVKRGQKANITIDAVPNRVFTGTVKFISPFGTQTGKVIKFAITIELDPTDVPLRGGLSATADISIYSAKNVLLVPVSVIATTPAGPVVAVLDEATGQVERRRITIGQQNFQFAEVLSGLKEGEKLQAIKQTGARSTQQSQGTVSPRMLVPR
jgi:RND family efflux transporter MFP subunit